MLSIIIFIGSAVFLCIQGRLFLFLFFGKCLTRTEQWVLGFPIGAFLNVLLFFIFTITSIPLSIFVVGAAHVLLMVILGFLTMRSHQRQQCFDAPVSSKMTSGKKLLLAILLLSIIVKLGYGMSHAIIFPTYYYDSISQWTMRARVSYEDRAIAFDRDEERGISKPQYPIMLHSIQIFFMLPQGEWKDRTANASTLLLTLSSFAGFFLLLARKRGVFFATLTIATLLMVPLLSQHMAQGYGDIHILTFLLLSSMFLFMFIDEHVPRYLLLSGIFAAAAAWVKLDGLFFVLLPWLAITSGILVMNRSNRRQILLLGILPAFFLGTIWSAFLSLKGLPLSPHGDTLQIEWHPEAVLEALRLLFASGSFGVHWYALIIGVLIAVKFAWKNWKIMRAELAVCIWGIITLGGALFIYLFTPNVQFLLNAQTFSRTMLIPLFLLTFGVMLILQTQVRHAEEPSHSYPSR